MDANFQAPAYALILSATYTNVLPHILQVSRCPMADSLQFSLIRAYTFLCLVPEAALEGRDWENVGENVCICTHIQVCVPISKERETYF